MMNAFFEAAQLGRNEQRTFSFRKCQFKGQVLRFFFKLFIIISSVAMVIIIPEMSKWTWCSGVLVAYGRIPVLPFLSMLFSTVLMIIDFIIPCITNKKISGLVNILSSLLCLIMFICFMALNLVAMYYTGGCLGYHFYSPGHELEDYQKFVKLGYGLGSAASVCTVGWFLLWIISVIQLIAPCMKSYQLN